MAGGEVTKVGQPALQGDLETRQGEFEVCGKPQEVPNTMTRTDLHF